jgi:hypothetical protein
MVSYSPKKRPLSLLLLLLLLLSVPLVSVLLSLSPLSVLALLLLLASTAASPLSSPISWTMRAARASYRGGLYALRTANAQAVLAT